MPRTAVDIPYKIHRDFLFNNHKRKENHIVTSHGLQMAEAADDVLIIIERLSKYSRYDTIYRELGVTEQKNDFSANQSMSNVTTEQFKETEICHDSRNKDSLLNKLKQHSLNIKKIWK